MGEESEGEEAEADREEDVSPVEVGSDMSGDELDIGSEEEEEEEDEHEGGERDEDSDDSGEEGGGEIGAEEMARRMSSSAAPSQPARVDVSRILTPADFERIRRLKQLQEQAAARRGMTKAQKRRLSEMADDSDDEDDGPASALALEGEAVDPLSIAGAKARKAATREEKLAATLAGREDRPQFGRRKKVKSGGTSNTEKKKTKNFIMTAKSRDVQRKVKRREEMARRARRSQKKMFRGKVRK